MRILVKLTDFHWDNYQGVSGKSIDLRCTFILREDILAKNISEAILEQVNAFVGLKRPFKQDNDFYVKSVEIISGF